MTISPPKEVTKWLADNGLSYITPNWWERIERDAPHSVKDAYKKFTDNLAEASKFKKAKKDVA